MTTEKNAIFLWLSKLNIKFLSHLRYDAFKEITSVVQHDRHRTIEMTWGETADTQAKVSKTSQITKSLFRPHVH
jgi:hypothetical protein